MTRVVLDTNVVVSAYLKPDGAPSRIVALVLTGDIRMRLTEQIVLEYREVLARFKLNPRRAALFSKKIVAASLFVQTAGLRRVSIDPDDDIFLECARISKASYLVTGNLRHFPSGYHYAKVLSPASFLARFHTLPGKL